MGLGTEYSLTPQLRMLMPIPKGLDPRARPKGLLVNISQTIGNVIGNWLDYMSFLPIFRTFLGSLLVISRV